jgi:hypothetical protein
MSCWFCLDVATMDKKVSKEGQTYLQCQVCGATDTGKLLATPQKEFMFRDMGGYGYSPMSPYAMPFVQRNSSMKQTQAYTQASS